MSLINDMLRNIEAKRPNDPARQNLQREIRSLPAPSSDTGRWIKPLLLVAVPLLGLAVLQANGLLFPSPGTEAPPVAAPVAAPAPVLAQAVTLAPPPLVAVAPEVKPQVQVDTAPVPNPPLKAAAMLAVPDPVVPAPRAEVASAPAPAPQSMPAGPVRIEKSAVLSTPRDRADVEYRKAENALASGRSGEAVESFRAALKQDPSYVLARQMLLRQLLDMRKNDEAISVLHDGLELQPGQTGWAMSLARLQLEQNDIAAADRTLAASQSYAEGNADYAGFQGHLKTRMGVNRAAVTYYQRATRLAPNEGRWWLGLGLALEVEGRLPEAKEALRRSLATNTLSTELAAVAEQHLH
jgi:MSHA biogenesis protein MshN